MKAASGELSLTVITIIAIGAVIAFFIGFFTTTVQKNIEDQWEGQVNVPKTPMIILK